MSRTRRMVLVTALAAFGMMGVAVDPAAASGVHPSAPAPGPLMYVVVNGDSVTGVAAKLHVSTADLLKLNHLQRTSVLHPGMHLVVPPGGSLPVPAVVPNLVYIAVKGDSVSRIAFKLRVTLTQFLLTNHLQRTSVIHTGQRFLVPAGGSLPVAAPVNAPPAAAGPTLHYTVINGDSLARIAVKLDVSLSLLLSTNSLARQSVIRPGMQLVVPPGGRLPTAPTVAVKSAPPVPSAQVYIVRSGDYLTGIANTLGVPLADFLAVNKLARQSVIHAGMRLIVPAGGRLPTTTSSSTTSTTTPPPTTATGNDKIDRVLSFAMAQLGEPYKFNAAGPDAWDCSGLTMAAYATIGISLPHYSAAQALLGTAVDWTTEPIRAGDLVFLESSPGSGVITHVGLAINATEWIQAPRTGDVVRIGAMSMTRVVAVRRFVPAG